MKLALWEMQLSQRNPVHFPCLKSQPVNHERMDTYKNILSGLVREFNSRFTVFTQLEKDFALFFAPRSLSTHEMCQRNSKWRWSKCSVAHHWRINSRLLVWNPFISACHQITQRWQPLHQRYFVCLGQHIYASRPSLWWTLTSPKCATGLHKDIYMT